MDEERNIIDMLSPFIDILSVSDITDEKNMDVLDLNISTDILKISITDDMKIKNHIIMPNTNDKDPLFDPFGVHTFAKRIDLINKTLSDKAIRHVVHAIEQLGIDNYNYQLCNSLNINELAHISLYEPFEQICAKILMLIDQMVEYINRTSLHGPGNFIMTNHTVLSVLKKSPYFIHCQDKIKGNPLTGIQTNIICTLAGHINKIPVYQAPINLYNNRIIVGRKPQKTEKFTEQGIKVITTPMHINTKNLEADFNYYLFSPGESKTMYLTTDLIFK